MYMMFFQILTYQNIRRSTTSPQCWILLPSVNTQKEKSGRILDSTIHSMIPCFYFDFKVQIDPPNIYFIYFCHVH